MPADQSVTFRKFAVDIWPKALDKGLMRAANVFKDAIQQRLARGYTSGNFVTQVATDAVFRGHAFTNHDGVRAIRVGIHDWKARLWEFGHHNPFTRKYERVEAWRETSLAEGENMAAAFHEGFNDGLGK